MANQAADQQCKRRQRNKSADKPVSSSCQEANTEKRQKLNGEGGASPSKFYIALREELNKRPFNSVAFDKSDIQEELQSRSSVLMLKSTSAEEVIVEPYCASDKS